MAADKLCLKCRGYGFVEEIFDDEHCTEMVCPACEGNGRVLSVSEEVLEIKKLRLALENTFQIARRIAVNGESVKQIELANHIMRFAREALPADAFSILRETTADTEASVSSPA